MSTKIRVILLGLALTMMPLSLKAQKFSVSTNVLDYACLGTMNAEFSYAFSRH